METLVIIVVVAIFVFVIAVGVIAGHINTSSMRPPRRKTPEEKREMDRLHHAQR